MPKKILIILSLFSVFCFLRSISYAQESITITTYYPSPYGVYKNLRIYPNDDSTPGAACTNEGEMYYDQSDHALYICSGTTTLTWVAVGGGSSLWTNTGNNLYPNNNAWNVGIGTTSPSSGSGGQLKLDVEGRVGATGYCDQNGNNCTAPTQIQQRVTGTCASNQAIRVINADGSVTCVNLPPSALCTFGSKTFSTGFRCCLTNAYYQTCGANGTWSQTYHCCTCTADYNWCTNY